MKWDQQCSSISWSVHPSFQHCSCVLGMAGSGLISDWTLFCHLWLWKVNFPDYLKIKKPTIITIAYRSVLKVHSTACGSEIQIWMDPTASFYKLNVQLLNCSRKWILVKKLWEFVFLVTITRGTYHLHLMQNIIKASSANFSRIVITIYCKSPRREHNLL